MFAALAKGARVLAEPAYASAAAGAVTFVLSKMLDPGGRLLHRYRDGEAAIPGHLDDYAFLIHGMLELYETTFEVDYLAGALSLNSQLLAHFWDDRNGGFYFTADDAEALLMRQKEVYDGAIPSGNSLAMLNLLRLGRITADAGLEEKGAAMGRAFGEDVSKMPSAYTRLLTAVDFAVGPSYEVVIAGDRGATATVEMLRAVRSKFLPNKIIVFLPPGPEASAIIRLAPFTANHTMIGGKTTAYVCRNYECSLPVTDAAGLLASI
jgi:uncharacterized protein YyaL (SSP411 family)